MFSVLNFWLTCGVGPSLGTRVSVFPFALERASGWSVSCEGRGGCEEPIQLLPLAAHSGQAVACFSGSSWWAPAGVQYSLSQLCFLWCDKSPFSLCWSYCFSTLVGTMRWENSPLAHGTSYWVFSSGIREKAKEGDFCLREGVTVTCPPLPATYLSDRR